MPTSHTIASDVSESSSPSSRRNGSRFFSHAVPKSISRCVRKETRAIALSALIDADLTAAKEAEPHHLSPRSDHDVCRLEISMGHSLPLQVLHSEHDLPDQTVSEDSERVVSRKVGLVRREGERVGETAGGVRRWESGCEEGGVEKGVEG